MSLQQDSFKYHCGCSWHFARMKSRYAAAIYDIGLKLSYKSKRFFCKTEDLATYFRCDVKTIVRAIRELRDTDFFILIDPSTGRAVLESDLFHSNTYRVVSHEEWAAAHPDMCAVKESFAWDGEGDPLAQTLYSLSGGRKKVMAHQVKWLRDTLLSEDEIVDAFKAFLRQWKPSGLTDRKYYASRFLDVLKISARNKNPEQLDVLIFQLYEVSGYVFAGMKKDDLRSMLYRGQSPEEIVLSYKTYLDEAGGNSKKATAAFCAAWHEINLARILAARAQRKEPVGA